MGTLATQATMEPMEGRTPDFELADVAACLDERCGAAAQGVTALSGRDWSAAFAFRLDGVELIARFSRYRVDFENDLVASGLSGPELPVPSLLEIGEGLSGYYAISERKVGVFLEALDETGWRRVLVPLMRALDCLRTTRVPKERGCQLVDGRPGP